MKHHAYPYLLCCLIVLLLHTANTLHAQSGGKKNKPTVSYKIQVAAYRNLNLAQLSLLSDIGSLFAEDAGNGVKRVVMGYYKTNTEANAILPKVHEKGFTAAFVTPHTQAISTDTLGFQSLPLTQQSAAAETKTTVALHNDDELPPLLEGEGYAIALHTTDLVITQKLPDMLAWGNVFVPQNDPDANTMLGIFDTPERALHVLDYVQANISEQATLCIINTETFAIISNRAAAPAVPTPTPAPPKVDTPPANKEVPTTKNPCGDALPTTTTETPPAKTEISPKPEAVYKSQNADATATKDPANDPLKADNAPQPTEVPKSILTLPPEALAGNISEAPEMADFSRFKTYFNNYDTVTTQIVIIAYDPTLDNTETNDSMQWDSNLAEINQKLRGVYIPANLVAMLDSLPKNDPTWSFYALFKYALDPMHDAYIVRAGKGEYHTDNNIYLAVYDKAVGDFTETQLISRVWGGGGFFGFKRSWIMDLDKDGRGGDLLIHTTEETNSPYDVLEPNYTLIAKVWKDGQYVDAQIIDETSLKQQLGVN